jgi:hypothetical protein
MDEGLIGAKHSRIDVRHQPVLVDAGNLLGYKRRMAEIVVDTGDAQEDDGDLAMLLTKELLGFDL